MTSTKTTGPALLARISTPYLRALGELRVCELRLRRAARSGGMGPAWQEATDYLLEQSEALQDRLAAGPLVEHSLQLQAPDGSLISADIVFVQRLVRRMGYQLGLATADVATATLPSAPIPAIRHVSEAIAS